MFKDFPFTYPLAVHFPIVLILLTAVFQPVLVWKKTGNKSVGLPYSLMTGAFFQLLRSVPFFMLTSIPRMHPKQLWKCLNNMRNMPNLTLWMSGITFLLLKSIGIFFKINRRLYEAIRWNSSSAAIIAAIFLSIAGHHGARLHTHISEVLAPMGRYLMKEHGMGGSSMKDNDGIDMKDDSAMKANDR